MSNSYLATEANAWIKRNRAPDGIIRVVRDLEFSQASLCYNLFEAYAENPDYLGRILFDAKGYWIYDGEVLTIREQEQVAKFIINYVEAV